MAFDLEKESSWHECPSLGTELGVQAECCDATELRGRALSVGQVRGLNLWGLALENMMLHRAGWRLMPSVRDSKSYQQKGLL